MVHSHLAVRHLIRQVANSARQRESKPSAPEWLREFISDLADCFDPSTGIARVGYRCCQHNYRNADGMAENRPALWTAAVFLGTSEQVGGADDGETAVSGFRFDISALLQRFQQVDVCCWNTATRATSSSIFDDDAEAVDPSFLTIEGAIDLAGDRRLRLQILSAPPTGLNPGLRHYANGRLETV